jgi:hypothetical protein
MLKSIHSTWDLEIPTESVLDVYKVRWKEFSKLQNVILLMAKILGFDLSWIMWMTLNWTRKLSEIDAKASYTNGELIKALFYSYSGDESTNKYINEIYPNIPNNKFKDGIERSFRAKENAVSWIMNHMYSLWLWVMTNT